MPRVPKATVRTTSDGAGYAHGILVVSDDDPHRAIEMLRAQADRVTGELLNTAEHADVADASDWGIEVVDVRLIPGADPETQAGWTAYGTLRTTGLSPLMPDTAQ